MNQAHLFNIILSPHLSEKVSILSEKHNTHVFEVKKSASKQEIKDAIEFLFNTKVKSINVVNVRPKKKMFRNEEGRRKGWKKVYVSLFNDQKLDIFGAQ